MPVQVDNLDNGQWPDLFAYEDSNAATTNINYIVIDADQDYYNIDRQIEIHRNRTFVDRGKPNYITSQAKIENFFNVSLSKKSRQNKSGILNTTLENLFQGIDIRNFRQARGLFKITAGTPGHLIEPMTYGLNESYSLTENDYFQDINLFRPIEFIDAQIKNVPIESVVTFPIVTSDSNQAENYILNGVIEPFPIRSVISYFSINFPFEPHGISVNFINGNPYLRSSTDQIEPVQKFNSNHVNKKIYYDVSEKFSLSNDEGNVTIQIGPDMPFMSFDENQLPPFIDEIYSRGDVLLSTRAYEPDLLSVINSMKSEDSTYLRMNEFSGRTGFLYDNNSQGVDSIAYGGLVRR